jgi:hypothetical protein
MQMNDEKFKRSLNQAEVPASLEKQLRDNWRAQLKEEAGHSFGVSRGLLSAVASVFVLVVALFAVGQQGAPEIVTLAMQDIATDAARSNQIAYRFDDAMRVQLQSQGISPPLPSMSVKMAKYCTLNKTRTTHLRIAGEVRGEVHVFIRDGEFDFPAWRSEQGELNAMHWQLIHPRDGLSVLVMRTENMNPQNVEALIQKMFYA